MCTIYQVVLSNYDFCLFFCDIKVYWLYDLIRTNVFCSSIKKTYTNRYKFIHTYCSSSRVIKEASIKLKYAKKTNGVSNSFFLQQLNSFVVFLD